MLSPSSEDGYAGVGAVADRLFRTAWRGLVTADILRKLQLMYRPYELEPGVTDQVTEASSEDVCRTIEQGPPEAGPQLKALRAAIRRARARFRAIPARRDRTRPLIGVVGEIFCRLNDFSNDQTIRRLEAQGAEAWISDIAEWIWYTNSDQFRKLKLRGQWWTLQHLGARIRHLVQQRDEHGLLEPVREDFRGLRGAGDRGDAGRRAALPAAERRLRRDGASAWARSSTSPGRAWTASWTSARSAA